jgi:branched-subunit amino acid transport protein
MSTWIAIVAVGVISYAFRAGPLVLLGRMRISERVDLAIRHAGAAAIAALFVSGLHRNAAGDGPPVAVIAAAVASLVVALRGGSLNRTVGAGLALYAALVLAGAG